MLRLSPRGEFHATVAEVGDERRVPATQPKHLRLLVCLRLELARQLAAQREQLVVERVRLLRLELRAEKGLDRLRVGHLLARERGEVGEFTPPPLARRL